MSNDVIEQVRRYLDYAAEAEGEQIAAMPSVKPTSVRWYQRGPVLAGLAALFVLAVATVPALLIGSGSQPQAASEVPDPLEVGVDYVWPEGGFSGSPEEIAAEFARQALGWTDVEATNSDPQATPDGPVWTTIQHPSSEAFEVLSIPIGDGRRVLIQVGSAGITTGPIENGDGQTIGFPPVAEADVAHLHIRFVKPDRVEVVPADHSDLARGRVDITQDSPIGGVIVVYVDGTGQAITATGAHFGPLDETTIPSGEVRVAEIPDYGMVLTHPADWYLAEESLTPNLSDPREVFSLGSFPLRPGGPNCAQIPSQALHDLEATDVFVTVQERGAANPSGFDPRPDNFGPTPGSTDNVFYECLEPEERTDVGTMHWIWFTDQDRYFHVLVALGRDAAPESVSAIWSTLDQLVIEPRD